jgi:hypothetical protein
MQKPAAVPHMPLRLKDMAPWLAGARPGAAFSFQGVGVPVARSAVMLLL